MDAVIAFLFFSGIIRCHYCVRGACGSDEKEKWVEVEKVLEGKYKAGKGSAAIDSAADRQSVGVTEPRVENRELWKAAVSEASQGSAVVVVVENDIECQGNA